MFKTSSLVTSYYLPALRACSLYERVGPQTTCKYYEKPLKNENLWKNVILINGTSASLEIRDRESGSDRWIRFESTTEAAVSAVIRQMIGLLYFVFAFGWALLVKIAPFSPK